LPKHLSSDHDPLYGFHLWQANLRILQVTEIKTVPDVPLSHPFVERLIGTVRREFLDRTLFWTSADLEAKLLEFQHYNGQRTQRRVGGKIARAGRTVQSTSPIDFASHRWQKQCQGPFQTPNAA
jgi:putative transposase